MQNSETRCGSSTANESCTVSTASAKKVYAGKTDLSRGRPLYTSTTSKWCRTCVQSHRGRLRCYDGFLQASSQDYQIVFRWTDLHNCSRILLKESFLVYEIIGLLLPKKKGTLGAGAVSARPVVSFRQRFFLLQNPSVWSKAIFRSKVRPRGTLELHPLLPSRAVGRACQYNCAVRLQFRTVRPVAHSNSIPALESYERSQAPTQTQSSLRASSQDMTADQ